MTLVSESIDQDILTINEKDVDGKTLIQILTSNHAKKAYFHLLGTKDERVAPDLIIIVRFQVHVGSR